MASKLRSNWTDGGPLEEQGRFRQRKFNGVQQWHLESIIRSLPNILLLSVILFFAGVCSFLFPVNKAVASTVIAFSGGGAILCGVAIIAGATSPLCPYQSAASRALKRMALLFSPLWWKALVRALVDLVVRRPPKLVRKILESMHRYPSVAPAIIQSLPTMLLSTAPGQTIISEQVEVAQAACWLLGTTSNRSDQIATAQFLGSLDRTAYFFAFEDSETRRRLVFLTHEAFEIWFYRPTKSNQEIAELLGLVLCRVLLSPSKDAARREDLTNHPLYQSSGFGGTFLRAFEFAWTKYSCPKFEDMEMILHIAFLLGIISRGSVIPQYRWIRLSRFFSVAKSANSPHLVDVLLGLWEKVFGNINPDKSSFNPFRAFGELVDEGDNRSILARDLSNALICGTEVMSSIQEDPPSELAAAQGYIACLQRASELSPQTSPKEMNSVIDGVASFILSSSTPGKSSSEWVWLSIEAVITLGAFINGDSGLNRIPITRDAPPGRLRIDDLITSAARIMLCDSESLATSKMLPKTQSQVLAGVRAYTLALARGDQELRRGLERRLERVLEKGRLEQEFKQAQTAVWDGCWDVDGPLEGSRERDLEAYLEWVWDKAWDGALGSPPHGTRGVLDGALRGVMYGTLRGVVHEILHGAPEEALRRALEEVLAAVQKWGLAQLQNRMLQLAENLSQRLQVESSIIRILLWVWKTTAGTQVDHSDKLKIFISGCQLWGPLEPRVDFTINGIKWGINGERITFNDRNRDNLLTPDDLNGILEFAEDLQQDRENSEFIARNADVGINRLYVHFKRRVDWNYILYDFREQRTPCPRLTGKGVAMIW